MSPLSRLSFSCALLLGTAATLLSQPVSLPLEFRQSATLFNFQSQRGVPISTVTNVPPGSDGRMPTVNESGSVLLPTTNQFSGYLSFGAIPGLTSNAWRTASNSVLLRGTNAFSGPVAQAMGLPVGTSNNVAGGPQVAIILRRGQIGGPYLSRQVSFAFGSIVAAPVTDENGNLLTNLTVAYWLPKPYPYAPSGETNFGFYWSPHAGVVYASQPGPVQITWIKSAYVTGRPADYTNALTGATNYFENGGNYFRLYTVDYIVSGSPVKTPRNIYWTEGRFNGLGKPVTVPSARVGAVSIAYHKDFPERVPNSYVAPGDSTPGGTTNAVFQEWRTLWYDTDRDSILAYNREGRVFMELLGNLKENGDGVAREPLGFEIVDVVKDPTPLDTTIELGERILPPLPDPLESLTPEPVLQVGAPRFAYLQNVGGTGLRRLYATRETANLNDYQIHWMETSVAGLMWPKLLGRYQLVWPTDVEKYSHYVRPLVATEAEAAATAVPLPTANAPILEYQDPLDQPRGKLTETYRYYTWLDEAHPVHRALLRFNSSEEVAFERVFSWLDVNLKSGEFTGNPIATNLNAWNPTNSTLQLPGSLTAPRVVNQTVNVGERINAPVGEPSAAGHYLAGHINLLAGTLFNVLAYVDPFEAGFDVANRGAIIPVNDIPGTNYLEVWWFRTNAPNAGVNAANTARGFLPILWPSVVGRYTIEWPEFADEIVLASNDGSGSLPSVETRGAIYFQNDRSLPGFNPNEEHALMQGGQAYALRDDLNITDPNDPNGYSSAPHVLLGYIATDGRPAMHVFKVLREKGADTFNYQVEAGTVLQPPMPLPLMDLPLGPKPTGAQPRSLNQETYFRTVAGSTTNGELTTVEAHHFRPWFRELALQSPDLQTLKWFFATNVDYRANTLIGVVSDRKASALANGASQPPLLDLQLTDTDVVTNSDDTKTTNRTYRLTATGVFRYENVGSGTAMAGQNVYLLAPPFSGSWELIALADAGQYVEVGRSFTNNSITTEDQELTLGSPQVTAAVPDLLEPFPSENDLAKATLLFVESTDGLVADEFADWRLRTEPVPASGNTDHASFVLQDSKGNLWVYRGPHEADEQPWMAMQFYYRTLPGFFFPTLPLAQQPPPGIITPYLRDPGTNGTFVGDPVFGNRNDSAVAGDNNAFAVHYRPVWPAFAPVLQMAETLTVPKRGLPAVRGQTSLEVIYQQSQVTNMDRVAVRLHDPTREKEYELGEPDGTARLGRIPDSVKTETSRGQTYFPTLPPHLSQRFFLDPNRGSHGKLVFQGEFVDEIVGDKYLNLNVLSVKDATTLSNLCLISDPARGRWNAAIAGLSTKLEQFVESPQQPGTYIPAEGAISVGPHDLAEVTDDDVAVDSYALTAVGPGSGYVSLIAGNGLAFTPRAEPVSVLVLRVSDVLYPGELKIIQSPNPLAEQLTMQQVVDLAGKVNDFGFEWKIAAPVDGLPPKVYENTRRLLLGDGDWSEVPFPLATDQAPSIHSTPTARVAGFNTQGGGLVTVSTVPFSAFVTNDGKFEFTVEAETHLTVGNQVTLRGEAPSNSTLVVNEFLGTVLSGTTATKVVVDFGRTDFRPLDDALHEAVVPNQGGSALAQSIVFREFTVPSSYSQVWLSLDLSDFLGANVYLNGERVVVANQATDNTPVDAPPTDFLCLPKAYRLSPTVLTRGGNDQTQRVVVELFSQAVPGIGQSFNLRLEAYEAVDRTDQDWVPLAAEKFPDGIRTVLGESADVRALTDNYVIMRYRATNSSYAAGATNWSRWTTPQLAEGWIKRVLAGINPFNQRVRDLFNNQVNTDASLLTSAGHRWEGDVALNLESINSYGLIEIYETVLRRGRMLSVDGGINYGPANDALLLAAGYLHDLYMMEGNEASADAANPTIGFGTADNTYGDIATALFAFKGQVSSLLEEELSLLRGRDDFLQPSVAIPPFYNRLVWNYTRGIDAGEVVYALNYNIQENPNQTPDGVIDAADAARLFPQGHGDAYGHYLTALKGYYSLLLNNSFEWVPRIEAVTVLGVPVSVDYQDERKFAAAAAAVARAGRQIFDLTWRKDYQPGHSAGWSHFSPTRVNTAPPGRTRHWGLDHWANRTGQGGFINWVVGNAILPAVDPDPTHEGIQKIDRTTVLELTELATMASDLQAALDNAEGALTPLGLPQGSLAMDINPNVVVGPDNGTHFEQIYGRAKATLNNAVAAFDDAKNVTQLMRSEQDSLAGVQAAVAKQELAYDNELIELYGTPYTDDIGPGRTYKQGYTGPDLLHYTYTDMPQLTFPGLLTNTAPQEFRIDIQNYTPGYEAGDKSRFSFVRRAADPRYLENTNYIAFTLDSSGNFQKPATWTGRRASPGKIQEAIARIHLARNGALGSLSGHETLKRRLDRSIEYFQARQDTDDALHSWDLEKAAIQTSMEGVTFAGQMVLLYLKTWDDRLDKAAETAIKAIPESTIVGLANGGDILAGARAAVYANYAIAHELNGELNFYREFATGAFTLSKNGYMRVREAEFIGPLMRSLEHREAVLELDATLGELQQHLYTINQRLQELDDAVRNYQTLIARGDRIQAEREVTRQRTSAVVQGYRTRDAAFRIFRNEKLERYKTLFDLSARYAFLAANAYDYETGLLDTTAGRNFVNRIVSARALGVIRNGEPQYAGSNTGDPGLSSALAEMKADWDVVKTRLGFNNPDAYGTIVSLRVENFRVLPTTNSDTAWMDLLQQSRRRDVMVDEDVRRHCLQISRGEGLPVPGIIITFSTTIDHGYNLFGQPLAAGDHAFSPSSFATKIFGVGASLEGYRGMDQPAANGNIGGITPPDPNLWFLDPLALAATPYVYLVPVGVDSMRSPPLGDASDIRSWTVDDVAIPLPFNIGAWQLSSGGFYQSADSLTEPLFTVRSHQAFRPVPSASFFSTSLYGTGGTLQRSQYTNNRLIGRSVWNSRWKLVIPGHTLLNEPDEGLDRFIKTVRDIKLQFVTYSYSGN